MEAHAPLALSDFGMFYVAGRNAKDGSLERAYVQYFIPAEARHLPVLFAHGGGGISGSCWETTPDGRPGWLKRFLRAGWPCYIVDNVTCGRAVVGQLPGVWEGIATPRVDEMAWDVFRIGPLEAREAGTPFPGSQFPSELFDSGEAATPGWPADVQPSVAALVATARHIGPCVYVGHSGGARFGFEVADLARDVVKASVLIEPARVEGEPRKGITRQLILGGDFLDRSTPWSKARTQWRDYEARARAAGAPVALWELPDKGIHGNGHMMMLERNSDAIADLVMDWLAKT